MSIYQPATDLDGFREKTSYVAGEIYRVEYVTVGTQGIASQSYIRNLVIVDSTPPTMVFDPTKDPLLINQSPGIVLSNTDVSNTQNVDVSISYFVELGDDTITLVD